MPGAAIIDPSTGQSVDKHGIPVSGVTGFPEQAIFTEWQQSDFAIGNPLQSSCQSCHMPKVEEPVFLSSLGGQKRTGFSQHSFLAANTVLQDMLHNFAEELGVPANVDFLPAIERIGNSWQALQSCPSSLLQCRTAN